MNFTAAEINALRSHFVGARTYHNPQVSRHVINDGVARSLTNGTGAIVNYNTEIFDPFDLVTIGASWVFTAKAPGCYRVSAALLLDGSTAWADGEVATLDIYKSGVFYSTLVRDDRGGGVTIYKHLVGSDTAYLDTGNTLQVIVTQSSGGALNIYNPGGGDGGRYNYVAIEQVW